MGVPETCSYTMCCLEKSFSSGGTEVLTVKIEYPKFELPNCGRMESVINRSIWGQVECFFHDAATILYRQASCALHNSNNQKDYLFNPYDAVMKYQVTTCNSCYVSLYRDAYEFTGGAHGNTVRRSDSWSLNACRAVQACDFFLPKTMYRKAILQEILFQADENMRKAPGIYFENYQKLITRYFNPNRFYVTENSVTYYFQLYEIAPYVSGIVTFPILFDQLDCPPVCNE